MNTPHFVSDYIASYRSPASPPVLPPRVRTWLEDNKHDIDLMKELAGQDGMVPYKMAQWLSKHPDVAVRAELASNWGIDSNLIDDLARDPDDEVKECAAQNLHANPESLWKLSKHPSPRIRIGLTWNTSTPDDVVRDLENDEDPGVAFHARRQRPYRDVCVRPEDDQLADVSTSKDAAALERHSRSDHASVRIAVLKNASTPSDTVRAIILGDQDKSVQLAGVQWDQAPKAVLKAVAEDDYQPQDVRIAAMHNPRVPRAVLERLKRNTNPTIADDAEKALAARP